MPIFNQNSQIFPSTGTFPLSKSLCLSINQYFLLSYHKYELIQVKSSSIFWILSSIFSKYFEFWVLLSNYVVGAVFPLHILDMYLLMKNIFNECFYIYKNEYLQQFNYTVKFSWTPIHLHNFWGISSSSFSEKAIKLIYIQNYYSLS